MSKESSHFRDVALRSRAVFFSVMIATIVVLAAAFVGSDRRYEIALQQADEIIRFCRDNDSFDVVGRAKSGASPTGLPAEISYGSSETWFLPSTNYITPPQLDFSGRSGPFPKTAMGRLETLADFRKLWNLIYELRVVHRWTALEKPKESSPRPWETYVRVLEVTLGPDETDLSQVDVRMKTSHTGVGLIRSQGVYTPDIPEGASEEEIAAIEADTYEFILDGDEWVSAEVIRVHFGDYDKDAEHYLVLGQDTENRKYYLVPLTTEVEFLNLQRELIDLNGERYGHWQIGKYSDSFRELASIAEGMEDVPLEDVPFAVVRDVVSVLANRSGESIEVFGATFPRQAIPTIGVGLIVAAYVYLLLHLTELSSIIKRNPVSAEYVPWVFLFSDRTVRQLSVVLAGAFPPIAVVVAMLLTGAAPLWILAAALVVLLLSVWVSSMCWRIGGIIERQVDGIDQEATEA